MKNNGMDKVKVGNTVKVIWEDSGCHYNRAGFDPSDCEVSICVNYGKLVDRNKSRIVVASHHHANGGNSPHNDQYSTISRRSVRKIRQLR